MPEEINWADRSIGNHFEMQCEFEGDTVRFMVMGDYPDLQYIFQTCSSSPLKVEQFHLRVRHNQKQSLVAYAPHPKRWGVIMPRPQVDIAVYKAMILSDALPDKVLRPGDKRFVDLRWFKEYWKNFHDPSAGASIEAATQEKFSEPWRSNIRHWPKNKL